MDDFAYMDRSRVDETSTEEYEFALLLGRPVLICSPATQENPGFFNAARVAMLAMRAAKPKNASPEQERAHELQERLLLAQMVAVHCVRGWKPGKHPAARVDVVHLDAAGLEVPEGTEGARRVERLVRMPTYSIEATRAFLENLAKRAPNLFGLFVNWIQGSWNFFALDFSAVEESAGNSAGG